MNTQDDFIKSRNRFQDRTFHRVVGKNYRDFGDTRSQLQKEQRQQPKFQCPLKCQGGKIYNYPGKCPGSKMDLIPVGGGYIFY